MTASTKDIWAECLSIIEKETGIEIDDIDDQDHFATDLGVNPIVARSIVAGWEAIIGKTLPVTLFDQYPAVEDVHRYVESLGSKATKAGPQKSQVPLSVVLQGNPSTCENIIFLLPDGSGSGMAYASIPPISQTTCLVAMNSPYLNRASSYTCSIEQIAELWIDEIFQRQPTGPYIVGGWSAGGYYSYEVSKALIQMGEKVKALILLDSPCRPDFEALPMEVVEYLSKNGLMGSFGTKEASAWVVNHFESTIRAVRQYIPFPIDAENVPEVYIIWAREGLLPSGQLEKTGLDLTVKVSRFLLDGKPNFGTHGWQRLFPGAILRLATISGNHFTLIHKPHINEVGELLRDVVTAESERRKDGWQTIFGSS